MERVIDWSPSCLPVVGGGLFPVRHVWCVGRNYAEHALEMGADPEREPPVFFSKPGQSVVADRRICYPRTDNLHHEVELVVLLGLGGQVYGHAVGVDLTRRDVQSRAKQAGEPWELAKGFDQSGPVGEILPVGDWQPRSDCSISLEVNGQRRQGGLLGEMIWDVDELLARLSADVTLAAGDVIFTGTPAGVGPLQPGDAVRAEIQGLPPLELTISER